MDYKDGLDTSYCISKLCSPIGLRFKGRGRSECLILAASMSRLLDHLCLTFCADGAKAAALVTREAIKAIFMVKVSWDMLGAGQQEGRIEDRLVKVVQVESHCEG